MQYSVAIIGAGKWSENHLAGWRAQPDVKVTWVVRSNEERAKQKATAWGISNWSADYKEVMGREDIDIVDILLPHDLHAEAACLALSQGKHVLLEKPIAQTLQEAKQIAAAARQYKRRVMIAENWVYSTMVQKAQALLTNGEIGTPFMIRAIVDLDTRSYFTGLDWKYSRARSGGGGLMDGAIHCVSTCRYLLGDVREVSAMMSNHGFREIAPMEDTTLLSMRFESGASGAILHTWVAQRERPRTEVIILGNEGTIEFEMYSGRFFVTRKGQRCEHVEQQQSRGFVEEISHFLECLRGDREPMTSPEEQIGTLKVVLAAYQSTETGRVVRVADLGR